jgi:hypothetical protein
MGMTRYLRRCFFFPWPGFPGGPGIPFCLPGVGASAVGTVNDLDVVAVKGVEPLGTVSKDEAGGTFILLDTLSKPGSIGSPDLAFAAAAKAAARFFSTSARVE